jgi:hypothetical protein
LRGINAAEDICFVFIVAEILDIPVFLCSSCIGRAGVPMEVMGLMLGQFVDDYTITCVDVFAMPQVNL